MFHFHILTTISVLTFEYVKYDWHNLLSINMTKELFYNYFYLRDRVIKETETNDWRIPILWFTPQMARVARTVPGTGCSIQVSLVSGRDSTP